MGGRQLRKLGGMQLMWGMVKGTASRRNNARARSELAERIQTHPALQPKPIRAYEWPEQHGGKSGGSQAILERPTRACGAVRPLGETQHGCARW